MEEIEERLQTSEKLYEALLYIMQLDKAPIKEILDYILDVGIKITNSKIGYLYLYDEDTKILVNHAWSEKTKKLCMVKNAKKKYELDKAGFCNEAIRKRKPIIVNDYLRS